VLSGLVVASMGLGGLVGLRPRLFGLGFSATPTTDIIPVAGADHTTSMIPTTSVIPTTSIIPTTSTACQSLGARVLGAQAWGAWVLWCSGAVGWSWRCVWVLGVLGCLHPRLFRCFSYCKYLYIVPISASKSQICVGFQRFFLEIDPPLYWVYCLRPGVY